MSRAVSRAGREIAGNWNVNQEYDKAYMPWDELVMKVMEQNPEMYGADNLVLDEELELA